MAHLTKNYSQFFMDLAPNNTSEWFNENRKRYEKDVKIPFQNLVADLITQLAKIDKNLEGIKPSDCIFRINRDIRFSKDKTLTSCKCLPLLLPEGEKT
jgi:uncharacterized protein (TIGR02453 family)